MKTLRHLEVPTGDILVVEGEKGPLELVSLGDYGKDVNLKADFLGLDRTPEIVKHQKMLPLEEKWVITISTQYGCSMGCRFCDVPKVGPGKNATLQDMINQIKTGMLLHPEVTKSNRLNIHFARMGEPTWNYSVVRVPGILLRDPVNKLPEGFHIHPVVSTMMPKRNSGLHQFLADWMHVKNGMLEGEAGLQLSINSTSEIERFYMFSGNALSLHDISHIMSKVEKPRGRKITLNFIVAKYEINPEKLLQYFDPEYYVIKLTPTHVTETAKENGIRTRGDYTTYNPYHEIEKALKKAGYDVLVFLPSKEEDDGLITCGNAILSGSLPRCEYKEIL